jgi:hypothetical protein
VLWRVLQLESGVKRKVEEKWRKSGGKVEENVGMMSIVYDSGDATGGRWFATEMFGGLLFSISRVRLLRL